jgi:hypothetical protein
MREWAVVVALGLAGLAVAAVAVLTPWHLGVNDTNHGPVGAERVVSIEIPGTPAGGDVLRAARDLS